MPLRSYGDGGGGVVVIRLLVSHLGEPGSIPGGVAPGLSHVGIVPDDASGLRVFLRISRVLCTFIPGAAPYSSLHSHILSRTQSAAQISSHSLWSGEQRGERRGEQRGEARLNQTNYTPSSSPPASKEVYNRFDSVIVRLFAHRATINVPYERRESAKRTVHLSGHENMVGAVLPALQRTYTWRQIYDLQLCAAGKQGPVKDGPVARAAICRRGHALDSLENPACVLPMVPSARIAVQKLCGRSPKVLACSDSGKLKYTRTLQPGEDATTEGACY
ncbi:hypothetical protein PR048_006764 [Dryococelus australis]|uniref:Uncharacterized protein n=1 Tax=Dryococelus australis TaxID=614101 RepID=A0ABQ9IBU5_9NEOP|nr:hypothetical protein PR048_006764 [Dryococelus australis]